jgi:aerobic carbon-monoxide dehydrogenase medium subunit
MYSTKYHNPASIDAATSALSSGSEAKVLAGGQTLLPTMKQHLAEPSDLVDIRGIAGMTDISASGATLTIGAAATHASVASNADVQALCPALAGLAAHIGDPAVRHMGTIGGSLANNDPAADYPAAALAMGATIVTNSREIAADDFFDGLFATALEDGEIITAIRFETGGRCGYAKFPNPASRYAMVGVFVAQSDGGARVAITGAGDDGVFRHGGLEAALSADWSEGAVAGVDISPDGLLSDFHGDSTYRANLIGVMAKRAVAAS